MSQSSHQSHEENPEAHLARHEPTAHRSAEPGTDLHKRVVGTSFEKHMVTATGETVTEVSPAMQYFRVHDIMEQLTSGFERKSTAERITQAKQLAADAGVETDTTQLEASLTTSTAIEQHDAEATDDFEKSVYTYLHKLAEDIVDALNEHKRSIAVIEADSIGEKTTNKLGIRGDVNFIINKQAGMELVASLKNQHNPMKVRRQNEYGFILWNKELNMHMVFVYQDGLGKVKTEQEPKAEEYEDLGKAETKTKTKEEVILGSASETSTNETEQAQADAAVDLEKRRAEVEAAQGELAAERTVDVGSFAVDPEDRAKAA